MYSGSRLIFRVLAILVSWIFLEIFGNIQAQSFTAPDTPSPWFLQVPLARWGRGKEMALTSKWDYHMGGACQVWSPEVRWFDTSSAGLKVVFLPLLQLIWLGFSDMALDGLGLLHCPVVLLGFSSLKLVLLDLLVLLTIGGFWPVDSCSCVFGYSTHEIFSSIANNRGGLG